jgi:hypothetical protein
MYYGAQDTKPSFFELLNVGCVPVSGGHPLCTARRRLMSDFGHKNKKKD